MRKYELVCILHTFCYSRFNSRKQLLDQIHHKQPTAYIKDKIMGYRDNSEIQSAYNFFTNGNGVVTLCGSTKFFTECMEANRRLTFDGWIVLMCGSWGHSYHKDLEGNSGINYENVKTLHYKKILMSQAIVVVSDKTGYIGNSTKAEIAFCEHHNIPTFYFDGEYLTGETVNEIPKNLNEYDSAIEKYTSEGHNLGF